MKNNTRSGQMLTTLLIFMAIAATITTGAVALIISGSTLADKFQEGTIAMQIAESASENALLRLIRNPSYTGETMAIDGGTATIAITGTTSKTIDITGRYGTYVRKLRISTGYSAGLLQVTPPWTEIYP